MKVQLHSIHHAPTSLPYWQTLMDDLCNPAPHEVARVLGLSERTIFRYNASGCAPRVACLAVFWLTHWGRNAVHTQAHNDALLMGSYVEGLRSQVKQLESKVSHLLQIGDFGAANEPNQLAFTRRLRRDRLR